MFFTTHVLAGLTLGLTILLFDPQYLWAAVIGAVLGSALPDLDFPLRHRRSLHFPVVSAALILPTAALAAVTQNSYVIGGCYLLGGMALHCLLDMMGNGHGPLNYKYSYDNAVYNHVTDEWIGPTQWLDHAGSRKDIALAGLLVIPPVVTLDRRIGMGVILFYVISVIAHLFLPQLRALVPDFLLRFYAEQQGFDAEKRQRIMEDPTA